MIRLFALALLVIAYFSISARDIFIVSEKSLMGLLDKDSPDLQRILVDVYGEQVKNLRAAEPFQYTLTGSLGISTRKDVALNQFDNVIRSGQREELSLNKKTKYGFGFRGYYEGNKFDNTMAGVTASSYL